MKIFFFFLNLENLNFSKEWKILIDEYFFNFLKELKILIDDFFFFEKFGNLECFQGIENFD